MCMKKRPSAASQTAPASAIRASSSCARTFRPRRCGRTVACGSNPFMSAVTTRRFFKPRACGLRLDIFALRMSNSTPRQSANCGNCRAIHSDSEPQPQPSSRIDWPSARSACSTVWRSASSSASCSVDVRLLVEAGGIFAVRAEHAAEERRRHLVMLGVGRLGMFGDGARRHACGERCVVCRRCRWQAAPPCASTSADRGADHEIGQRHPLGGADHLRHEAHVTAPLCGGSGKKSCVRA